MKRIVHIDGDIIVYSVGFASEADPIEYALHSVKKMIESIVEETGADEYVVYLSGPSNFRDDVASLQPYKGNRESARKPVHYEAIRSYLTDWHNAIISDGDEADDLLGIACSTDDGNVHVLASIDKDLNMIEGLHYNWRKRDLYTIEPEEADRFFIEQLLTGDATDNIPGLKRITGKVATKKIKDWCKEPDSFVEMFNRVRETYIENSYKTHAVPMLMDAKDDMSLQEVAEAVEECRSIIEQDVDVCLQEIGTLLWIKRADFHTFGEYYDYCLEKEKADNSGEVLESVSDY